MKRRKQMRVRFFSLDYLIFADNYREEEDEMIQRGEMEMMERRDGNDGPIVGQRTLPEVCLRVGT